MIKELIKLANHLDSKGLRKEADYIDALLEKAASNSFESALTEAITQGFSSSPFSQESPLGWMTQASNIVSPESVEKNYSDLTMSADDVKSLKERLKSLILTYLPETLKGRDKLASHAVDNSLIPFSRIENGILKEW